MVLAGGGEVDRPRLSSRVGALTGCSSGPAAFSLSPAWPVDGHTERVPPVGRSEITIDTDGDAGNATGTLTATAGHPFWGDNQHRWLDAKDLPVGDRLRTPQGELRNVVNTRAWTEVRKVYNLTVGDFHTYYVLAGATPILVHNSLNPCNYSVQDLDSTVARMGFSDRNAFGQAAWGGRSLADATKLKTTEQVATMKEIGMTRSDAQYWRNFYQNIHNKSVAKFPDNPEKVNPSAGSRADLFQYYMDHLGE